MLRKRELKMNQQNKKIEEDWIDRSLDWVLSSMATLSGVILFFMMFLVVANTMSRKFFNAPIFGAFEVTQSLLTLAIFLSIAYTQREGGHINVDVLSRHFSKGAQSVMQLIAPLFGVVCFVWATYANWIFAYESYLTNEQEWGAITYPIWPVKMAMCAGLGLLAIQFFADFLKHLRATLRGNS